MTLDPRGTSGCCACELRSTADGVEVGRGRTCGEKGIKNAGEKERVREEISWSESLDPGRA